MAKDWQRLVLEVPPEIVTLIGMGFTSGQFVPDWHTRKKLYARKDHQVWAVNHAALWYPVADLCCAMDDMERDRNIDRDYVEGLEASGIPVLTSKAYRHEHIEYPLWEVVDDVYNGAVIPPIDNTITAALALCIHMKVKTVRCFGLDFCAPASSVQILEAYKRQQEKYGDVPTWFAFHEKSMMNLRRDREPGHVSSAFIYGVAHERGMQLEICPGSTFLNADLGEEPFPNGYQDTAPLNREYAFRHMKGARELADLMEKLNET